MIYQKLVQLEAPVWNLSRFTSVAIRIKMPLTGFTNKNCYGSYSYKYYYFIFIGERRQKVHFESKTLTLTSDIQIRRKKLIGDSFPELQCFEWNKYVS